MDIKKYREIIVLAESQRETLVQEKLPYGRNDLDPVMSEKTLDYHYGKLAAGYVKRYNDNEGDDDFNYGGAKLHNLFFPQLTLPSSGNKPSGISAELINKKYKNFNNFKDEFSKIAMGLQGSGWIYMDDSGDIKTIPNHQYQKSMKIILLIDWWEHAWALDYEHDKARYLDNIWRIVDWSVVNDRLQGA